MKHKQTFQLKQPFFHSLSLSSFSLHEFREREKQSKYFTVNGGVTELRSDVTWRGGYLCSVALGLSIFFDLLSIEKPDKGGVEREREREWVYEERREKQSWGNTAIASSRKVYWAASMRSRRRSSSPGWLPPPPTGLKRRRASHSGGSTTSPPPPTGNPILSGSATGIGQLHFLNSAFRFFFFFSHQLRIFDVTVKIWAKGIHRERNQNSYHDAIWGSRNTVMIWQFLNWRHLSVEKSRTLIIRLYPEVSNLTRENPPIASFIIKVICLTAGDRNCFLHPGKLSLNHYLHKHINKWNFRTNFKFLNKFENLQPFYLQKLLISSSKAVRTLCGQLRFLWLENSSSISSFLI